MSELVLILATLNIWTGLENSMLKPKMLGLHTLQFTRFCGVKLVAGPKETLAKDWRISEVYLVTVIQSLLGYALIVEMIKWHIQWQPYNIMVT